MPTPIQRYSYIMLRNDLPELPDVVVAQGQLGYRLVGVINQVDSSDVNHHKYYTIWELPL